MYGSTDPIIEFQSGNSIRNRVTEIYPNFIEAGISHLEPSVERAFREAESVWIARNFNAAGVMYRRAIERALKHLHPELNGTLAVRIHKLGGTAEVPATLVQLLDRVRYLGNDAAHDEDVTEEDARAGREFMITYLRYAYELPAQIEAAIARRKGHST